MIIEVEAPSNIAFLKYWGKSDAELQWPAGDSLSMTLKNAKTTTRIADAPEDRIFYNERLTKDLKISSALQFLRKETGYGDPLQIDTSNSFPSSCGIASSASGMAALTIAFLAKATESRSFDELELHGYSKSRISHLARRCSGSAGRSLYGGYVEWLKGNDPSSQEINPLFTETPWHLHDLILIVSQEKKSTSSSKAHQSAASSPLFSTRLAALPERLNAIKEAIRSQNINLLGPILESEALEMHAIIMTATPSIQYLLPTSTALLCWIREQRYKGRFKAWFTIDAGPNIHLICERDEVSKVYSALQLDHPGLSVIRDELGSGPIIKSW
jgi:diphosphomevalonate decarboxylase